MILIDLNQVLFSAVLSEGRFNQTITESYVRHTILNMIRSYSKQFKEKYGAIVLCCDSSSWRKDVFPFYKAGRKKSREKSSLDWSVVFTFLDKIKSELIEHLPYKVISINGAEADDIIGVLSARYSGSEDILIISSDKDFMQLQKYKNVYQYSPIRKMFIKTENPAQYIKEHIIKGDSGDGIPNFLSADNTFVSGARQKTITKEKLSLWLMEDPEKFCDTEILKQGYARNQQLVDLDYIPENIKLDIINAFDEAKKNSKMKILPYLISHRLSNLVSVCDEF